MTEVGTLQGKLSIDIRDFNRDMARIIKEVKELIEKFQLAESKSKKLNLTTLLKHVTIMNEEIDKTKKSLITFADLIGDVGAKEFASIATHTGRIKDNLDDVVKKPMAKNAGELALNIKEFANTTDLVLKDMDELTTKFQLLDKESKKLDITTLLQQVGMIEEELENTRKQLMRFVDAVGKTKVPKELSEAEKEQELLKRLAAQADTFERERAHKAEEAYLQKSAEAYEKIKQKRQAAYAAEDAANKAKFSAAVRIAEQEKTLAKSKAINVNMTTKATNEMRQLSGEAAKLKESLKRMNEPASQVKEVAEETKKQYRKTRTYIKKNTDELKNTEKTTERLRKSTRSWGSEVRHIISGIMISQAFYRFTGMFSMLVDEAARFAMSMEQAQVAYAYLLQDKDAAAHFIQVMQDFAIVSPMQTASVMGMSRRLMAMGFAAEAVLPTMTILSDAAAVYSLTASEQQDVMSRIVIALGQMRAAGRVAGQEMRQLYNAGVPVYTIFQEQFNLTTEQIRNIGDLGMKSTDAIIGILDWFQKKYSGAMVDMQSTVQGAFAVIKDTFNMIMTIMFQGPYQRFRTLIINISTWMQALVQIGRRYGAGGIMQAIVPEHMWDPVRNLIGIFKLLIESIIYFGKTFGLVFRDMFQTFLLISTIILPPLAVILNFLSKLVYALFANIAPLRYLFAILGGYFIIKLTASAFILLWKAISAAALITWVKTALAALWLQLRLLKVQALLFSKAWTIAILAVIASVFLLLSFSKRARDSLKSLWTAWQQLFKGFRTAGLGYDPNLILPVVFADPIKEADKFHGSLQTIADTFEDVGEAAKETGEKITQSFNQAFDEVFAIIPKEPKGLFGETDWTGTLDGLNKTNEALKNLSKFTGDFQTDWDKILKDLGKVDGIIIDWDFTDLFKDFWPSFIKDFVGTEKGYVLLFAAALAAMFAAVKLGAAGILIVAAVAALAIWLVSLFGPEIQKALGLTDNEAIALGIAAGIAAIIGLVKYGAKGALITLAIAGLAIWFIGIFGPEIQKALGLGDFEAVTLAIAITLATIITKVKYGTPKAIIVAAIAVVASWIVSLFWPELEKALGLQEVDQVSLAIAVSIAVIIGKLMIGTPKGIIMAAVAGFVGWFIGIFIEEIGKVFTEPTGLGAMIGGSIGTAIGGIIGGPKGAFIGTAIGAVVGWLLGKFNKEVRKVFTTPSGLGAVIGGSIGTAIGGIIGGPKGAFIGAAIGAIVGWIIGRLKAAFRGHFTGRTGVGTVIGSLLGAAIGGITGGPLGAVIGAAIGGLVGWIIDRFNWNNIGVNWNNFWRVIDLISPVSRALRTVTNFVSNWWRDLWRNRQATVNVTQGGAPGVALSGHARGGIFDKEHIARFAEGNKAEAIIPLENRNAMQPFADAISESLISVLGPLLVNRETVLTPVYVGTLIADDRGLKELERKLKIVRINEERRGV